MRAVLSLVVVLVVSAGCAQNRSAAPAGVAGAGHPLTGTWTLVSARYTAEDGTVTELDASGSRSMKVLNGTHFAFITEDREGEFVRAGGGPYRVQGDTYIETVTYGSFEMPEGSASFTYHVDGETWHHSGIIGTMRLEEVWRRVR